MEAPNAFRIYRKRCRKSWPKCSPSSSVNGSGRGYYSVDRLGRDMIELLNALNIGRAHFCGLSLGGIVGQWLGIHAPERIDRLILCNTASFLGPAEQWDNRIA